MERDSPDDFDIIIVDDFNSHAHVERDFLTISALNGVTISTHTLTWSVTEYAKVFQKCQYISTHTLTWSVTGNPILSE